MSKHHTKLILVSLCAGGGSTSAHLDEPLAWLPATQPSLALRVAALDSALRYRSGAPGSAARERCVSFHYALRPAPPLPPGVQPPASPGLAGSGVRVVPSACLLLTPG